LFNILSNFEALVLSLINAIQVGKFRSADEDDQLTRAYTELEGGGSLCDFGESVVNWALF
jgi:hypothetical protein